MAAFGNRITTTTNQFIMPKLVDTVLNSNVLLTRILGKSKKWNGERMKFPVKISTNNTFQMFSGFDTFSTSAVDTRRNMDFTPRFAQITIALPLDEISVNKTEEKVLDLIDIESTSSAQDFADQLGTQLYNADGTGNNFDSLANGVDDGTNYATYGNLSRTTYTTLKSTVTASGGTLTLAKMSALYNAVTSGSQKPTIGICDESVYSLYESLLVPQERIAKDVPMIKGQNVGLNGGTGLIGGTGYTGLFYKGFPILADEKSVAQTLYFLNEDFIDFYALPVAMTEAINYKAGDIEGNDYSSVKGLGFSFSGWVKPTNAAAVVGHVYLGGDLIITNPKRQGKLTGLTTV